MKVQSIVALAVVALAAAACGGGGGGGGTTPAALPTSGGTTTVTPTSSPVAAATATNAAGAAATFKIIVPASASSSISRRAQNIATGSNSITIQLIEAGGVPVTGTAQTFGITATSPGCTTANSTITCTLSVSAPVGTDVFIAETFASTDGSGTLLSSGAVQMQVAANTSNSATLSLDGTVASAYLASATGYLGTYSDAVARAHAQTVTRTPATSGTFIASTRIFVIALDDQGNAILNPTTFSSPIVLQQSFYYGQNPDVTLSVVPVGASAPSSTTSANYGTVTVNSPTDVITATLINNVTNATESDTIAAYIGSAPAAPTGAPTPLPSNVPNIYLSLFPTQALSVGNNPWQIIGLNSTYTYIYGGSGTYSITSTCSGIVNLTVQSNYYISASPVAAANCSMTLSDSAGDTAVTIPVSVTTTRVTGS
jgi:hypothetical protein